VVTLPEGEDPDTFVRAKGRDAIEQEIGKAMDVFERKLQLLRRGGWFDDLHKRREAIDRLLPTIRATTDPLLRDMYIGQASEVSRVDRKVLESEVSNGEGARGARGSVRRPVEEPAPPTPPSVERGSATVRIRPRGSSPRVQGAGLSAERDLIAAMVRSSAALERVLERLSPDDFRAPLHREIFSTIRTAGQADDLEALSDKLTPDAVALLDELTTTSEALKDLDQTVEHSLVRLEERRLQERNREIDRLMRLAAEPEKLGLIAEKMDNTLQLRELHDVRHKQ
jgi:DNA primase